MLDGSTQASTFLHELTPCRWICDGEKLAHHQQQSFEEQVRLDPFRNGQKHPAGDGVSGARLCAAQQLVRATELPETRTKRDDRSSGRVRRGGGRSTVVQM